MNICINIHINPKNVHKNQKSSRHLDKKWYHGTIQSLATAVRCCFFREEQAAEGTEERQKCGKA